MGCNIKVSNSKLPDGRNTTTWWHSCRQFLFKQVKTILKNCLQLFNRFCLHKLREKLCRQMKKRELIIRGFYSTEWALIWLKNCTRKFLKAVSVNGSVYSSHFGNHPRNEIIKNNAAYLPCFKNNEDTFLFKYIIFSLILHTLCR